MSQSAPRERRARLLVGGAGRGVVLGVYEPLMERGGRGGGGGERRRVERERQKRRGRGREKGGREKKIEVYGRRVRRNTYRSKKTLKVPYTVG